MQRQRRCYNPPPAPATWTQGVPGGTGPLGKRRRTQRISPLTPLLLTHLVENSHFPLSRLPPPTQKRTTAKTLGVVGDKAKTPATGVNVTPKKEEADLSQVDYFHCRKKGHYANKCLQKKKQESKN